jgi:hypothetical protein
MRQSNVALKMGHMLAMTAIFFAAVGMHLVHPAFHQNMPAYADRADGPPQHRAQPAGTGSHPHIRPYDHCPICMFLSKFHSQANSSELPVVTLGYAPKDLAAFEIAILQKPCGLTLGSRAPPHLPGHRV